MLEERILKANASELLCECMLKCIGDVLGKDVLQAILFRIPASDQGSPEALRSHLLSIFGKGTVVLERRMLKGFFRKLGLPIESRADFDQFVQLVNGIFESSQGGEQM